MQTSTKPQHNVFFFLFWYSNHCVSPSLSVGHTERGGGCAVCPCVCSRIQLCCMREHTHLYQPIDTNGACPDLLTSADLNDTRLSLSLSRYTHKAVVPMATTTSQGPPRSQHHSSSTRWRACNAYYDKRCNISFWTVLINMATTGKLVSRQPQREHMLGKKPTCWYCMSTARRGNSISVAWERRSLGIQKKTA